MERIEREYTRTKLSPRKSSKIKIPVRTSSYNPDSSAFDHVSEVFKLPTPTTPTTPTTPKYHVNVSADRKNALKLSMPNKRDRQDLESIVSPSAVALPIYRDYMGETGMDRLLSKKIKVELPKVLPAPAGLNTAKPVPENVNPEDPLAVGIFYHELGQLELSAYYFSISAARGDPTGLFLYAISLRHGWGMKQNEEDAFRLVFQTH